MNKLHKRSIGQKGFSLVETIVYLTIFVAITVAIINSTVVLAKSYRNVGSIRAIENSAISSMERMTREIRDATSINNSLTTYNTNPGVLALNSTNDAGTVETLRFYVSGNKLLLDRNGVNIGQLSLSDANISSLIFRSIATSTVSGVKIEMTIDNGSTTPYITKNFYGTAILRSSY
jgi:Tfp pilus assembly protein PilW